MKIMLALAASVPDPNPEQPPGTSGFVDIMGWVKWGGLALCVVGLIVGGAIFAVQQRQGHGEQMSKVIAYPLVGAVVIGASSAIIGALVT